MLLGTAGGPFPAQGRNGIASAVAVGARTYLVDAGQAATHQLFRSGLPDDSVRGVFVTHLHSDHIADLYNLVWLNWAPQQPGETSPTVEVFGPGRASGLPDSGSDSPASTVNPENPTPGTVDYFTSSIAATAYDVNERMRDTERRDIREAFRAHDITVPEVGAGHAGPFAPPMEPWTVHSDEAVTVSAILVDHRPVYPAFAFRFDTAEGSVVFSGDTTRCDNVVRLARGADVLVHEVIDLDHYADQDMPPKKREHLRKSHTDVNEVGELAAAAGVRTLVLDHLVPADVTAVSDREWKRKAQQGFEGEVVVGRDPMEIAVGERMPPRR
ncbi:ribonuclease BN (tRNA processing enzyme) [Haloactinomyces albus]|uniref:Ribonuclease BN (tRNA processing enzyme) n=1 Tax=Haloactinomyces albus TaxID=1352928 RepID=A0AAE4CND3_9ACTN|nr:ribonuclease BN (tRNA processing enzyme) [Haloactinomyces albus]